MPEIAPSPDYSPTGSIDRKFTERAMVLQAWGNYGTAWPVVHQQLGVRPDAGRGFLEVVPQVPGDKQASAGSAIRLGKSGAAAVAASRSGRTYTTRVQVGAPISKLAIGHTLPAGATVEKAVLDGKAVTPKTRDDQPRARGHGRHRRRARTRWWSRRAEHGHAVAQEALGAEHAVAGEDRHRAAAAQPRGPGRPALAHRERRRRVGVGGREVAAEHGDGERAARRPAA